MPPGKSEGGKARAQALSPEKRSEIARKAALAKAEIAKLPKATHGSSDHPLKIGDIEIPCYVLDDGTRVISQRGMVAGLGMKYGSRAGGADRLTSFAQGKSISPFINNALLVLLESPIRFTHSAGGGVAFGYPATLLADLCDAILSARKGGALQKQQEHIAAQAEILVRGFARVGIIALVDEATGYQKDRAKDALAQILEAFVAKELRPWVSTFPSAYYEEIFRLYGLQYPPANNKNWRPSFIGSLTNDVVYARLAPDLLPELKKAATKAAKKAKLHQWLTDEIGHPKLREHLASIVTLLKLSKTPSDFKEKVDIIHPAFGRTLMLNFEEH